MKTPTLTLHEFKTDKFHHIAVHSVFPFVILANKQGHVFLYDYEEKDVLTSFSVYNLMQYQREEVSLKKVNEQMHGVTMETHLSEKVGALKGVLFFDEMIAYWKIFKRAQVLDHHAKIFADISKKIAFHDDRLPRCIVLHMENAVLLVHYDQNVITKVEVDVIQFADGKTITSVEFFYSHPVLVCGCSDGSIRFYNYRKRIYLQKLTIKAHLKASMRLFTVHNHDSLSSYPSLISVGAEGSLASWNIEETDAEFSISSEVSTYDLCCRPDLNIIATLNYDKSIQVRQLNSQLSHSIKLPTKATVKTITSITLSNQHYSTYFLCTAHANSKIFSIRTNLAEESWKEIIDIKEIAKGPRKPKVYMIVPHPFRQDFIFVGTNVGIFGFQFLKDNSFYSLQKQSLLYVFQNTLYEGKLNSRLQKLPQITKRETVKIEESPNRDDPKSENLPANDGGPEPKVIREISQSVSIFHSFDGSFYSLFYDSKVEIYRSADHILFHEIQEIKQFVWSSEESKFAILRLSGLVHFQIYSIIDMSVQPVNISYTPICGKIDQIFGGKLIGVKYQDKSAKGFHFVSWSGYQAVGSFLPKPLDVVWDKNKVALRYENMVAVFSFIPYFRLQTYIANRTVEQIKWWKGSLFLVTSKEIQVAFISDVDTNIVILASSDVGFSKYSAVCECLNPLLQQRPLFLLDVIEDNVRFVNAYGTISSISLDHPHLKFKFLVTAGQIEQAMEWISYIPVDLHSVCADFLRNRGYTSQASSIDITPLCTAQDDSGKGLGYRFGAIFSENM